MSEVNRYCASDALRRRLTTQGITMPEAWIIDAVRTPRGIGKVGKGSLADIHPQVL